jgi:hypothetical protein
MLSILISFVKHHKLHSTPSTIGTFGSILNPTHLQRYMLTFREPLGKENTGTSYRKKGPLRCMVAIVFPLDYELLRTLPLPRSPISGRSRIAYS